MRHLDDVYFGILLRDAGITIHNDKNFTTAIEHLRKFKKTLPCGLYNIHGIYKIEEFIEIKNSQCTTNKRFIIDDWADLQDPDVDQFNDSLILKVQSAIGV